MIKFQIKRFLILLLVNFLFHLFGYCQCVEQQPSLPGWSGPSLSFSEGQQIRACEAGKVTSIEIYIGSMSGFPAAKMELYKGGNFDSLLWSSGIVSPTLGWWHLDVNSNYNFNEGDIFSVRWWNLSSQSHFYMVNMDIINPYLSGDMLNHYGLTVEDWDKSFSVQFNGTALPVKWSSPIIATQINTSVRIEWHISQQINNDKYIIEHSKNGIDYYSVGQINGNGTENLERQYSYIHDTPTHGINYYRIKQVDFDGQHSYSNVTSVLIDDKAQSISIYPNPANDEITIDVNEATEVIVMDLTGKVLKKQNISQGKSILNLIEISPRLLILMIGGQRFKVLKI